MKIITFAAIILMTFLFTYAQDVEDIIENVQDKYEDIDDLTATFKQIESFKLTGSTSETVGKIYIKEGVKYRFESENQVITEYPGLLQSGIG